MSLDSFEDRHPLFSAIDEGKSAALASLTPGANRVESICHEIVNISYGYNSGVDAPGYSNLSASVRLAVPADACIHVSLHPAYVSPVSSLGRTSTTLVCGVRQSIFADPIVLIWHLVTRWISASRLGNEQKIDFEHSGRRSCSRNSA